MKTIRWGGLITFVVIVTVLVAGALLFVEPITKSILESQLSELNNAKVDIEKVTINYSPFSIGITEIRVTDPEQPMTNMVDVDQAHFELSIADLFFNKVIINDMSLTGIQLDTPRTVSGKIIQPIEPLKEEVEEQAFNLSGIDLPDVNDILKKEILTADKLIAELNTDIQNTQVKWTTIKEDVNNKQRWDNYDTQYNKIETDFNGSTKEKIDAIKAAKQLSHDLKAEANKIKQAQHNFNTDIERLNNEFDAVKKSPSDDIKRIKAKFNLDQLDAGNITQLLFGEIAAAWVKFAQVWYARIAPYLEDDEQGQQEQKQSARFTGTDIAFKEFNPKPDLYIKNASIDAITTRGQFKGTMTQISSDQSINKQPMRFNLAGVDLKQRDKEEITGEFNYINKNKGFSQINYSMLRYQLQDFQLSKSGSFPLLIDKSLMTMDISTRLQQGVLTGNAKLNFDETMFTSENTSNDSSFSRMITASFADIHTFNIDAKFTGALDKMKFKIQSDLDNKIGAQLKTKINEKKAQFELALKEKINEKLKAPMTELEAKREQLYQLKVDVDAKQQELKQKVDFLDGQKKREEEIKKKELDTKKDAAVDANKDKVKDKLKGLFK